MNNKIEVAVKWHLIYQKYSLEMADVMYPYTEPHLNNYNDNLKKDWVITYWVWHIDKKKKVRKRATFSNPDLKKRTAEAKGALEELKKILKKGAFVSDKKNEEKLTPVEKLQEPLYLTIAPAIELYLKYCKAILKPNSYDTYKQHINKFESFTKKHHILNFPLEKITAKHAFAFLDELSIDKKLANKTRNSIKGDMVTFFKFLLERQHISHNPFEKIKTLPEKAGKHVPFTDEQVKRIKEEILAQGNEQLWLYVNFIYYLFARPDQEVRFLKVGDILEKTVRIKPEDAKISEGEHIRIPPSLEELIQKYKLRTYKPTDFVFTHKHFPSENSVGEKWFYKQHKKILDKLGINDKSYGQYSWKPTGVIALYRQCKDIKLVQTQCRHKDINTTDKYLRELGLFLDDNELNNFPKI